jgi:hypothetical protein
MYDLVACAAPGLRSKFVAVSQFTGTTDPVL